MLRRGKYVSPFLIALSIIVFAGCATTIYGIPEDQWDKMTGEQKQAAMEGYNEQERLREIERQKEAEREAREAEVRATEARRQDEVRKERIEAIYRGEAGQYGDLIRVTIQGGEMKIARRHRNYHPVSFKIADSETKKVQVVHDEGKYGTNDELHVLYQEGILYLDTYESDVRGAQRLVYDHDWKRGKTYAVVNSNNRLRIRNAQILIEIIPHLRKSRF